MRTPSLRPWSTRRAALVVALVVAPACEEIPIPVDAAVDAGPAPDAGDPDAGKPDVAVLACANAPAISFPRQCTQASDCALATHQINCCGTQVVTGIRADAAAAFAAAEPACRAGYPQCRCAVFPTSADDGSNEGDGRTAAVTCHEGRCQTSFPPATCAGTAAACGAGFACCYPCGVPGCSQVCEPRCADGEPGCVDGCVLRP